jgi:hypothetical protein
MKVWSRLLLCALFSSAIFSCKKSSNSPIPFLALIRLSPDTVRNGNPADTVYINFRFSDGDGDLGNDPARGRYDIYMADNRGGGLDTLRYFFPEIPDDAIDPVNGISGEGSLAVGGPSIRLRSDTVYQNNGDTVRYTMWIRDKAGNNSNPVLLPLISIRP